MNVREAIRALRPVVRVLLRYCLDGRSGSVEVVFTDGTPKHAHKREIERFGRPASEAHPPGGSR